jgi:hypothetical protein
MCSRHTAGLVALLVLLAATASCRRKLFPSRGDAAPVVVALPKLDAAVAPPIGESEPNNSPAQAQRLALDSEWAVVTLEGALGASAGDASTDVDVFKIVIPARRKGAGAPPPTDSIDGGDALRTARRLWLDVTSLEGAALAVQLLDDASKQIMAVSVDASSAAGMPNVAVWPGGTYYLRINPLAKSSKSKPLSPTPSRYKLTVQLGDFDIADEREPDDDAESAVPVVGGVVADMSGFHGWPRDQDYFRIAAPPVASILDVELDAVEGVSPGLWIVDDKGARLASARGRRGEKLALRNVSVPPATAVDAGAGAGQFLYVVVRCEAGQNRSERYVVHVALGTPRADSEIEPNDALTQATPVADGVRTGFLPIGDVDWFRYQSSGSSDVTFEVSFPSRVRGRLEVLRSGGSQPLASVEAKKPRQTLTLPPIQTQGDPILLKVSQARGDGNALDPYTIRVMSQPSMSKSGSAN